MKHAGLSVGAHNVDLLRAVVCLLASAEFAQAGAQAVHELDLVPPSSWVKDCDEALLLTEASLGYACGRELEHHRTGQAALVEWLSPG